MSSYFSCVVEIQICGGSQTWPWYVPELANVTFVVVSGNEGDSKLERNEGDSKLEQMGGEHSVSEWQLPPSPTGQLSGATLLTSSLGSPTSVSVIHYLPTRLGQYLQCIVVVSPGGIWQYLIHDVFIRFCWRWQDNVRQRRPFYGTRWRSQGKRHFHGRSQVVIDSTNIQSRRPP